jgi:hypothetical protein
MKQQANPSNSLTSPLKATIPLEANNTYQIKGLHYLEMQLYSYSQLYAGDTIFHIQFYDFNYKSKVILY